MKILQVALGVVAAFGGFVDIGELVFSVQAGAAFGYQLLWAVPVGVVGIVTYAEMSGRVAAITKRPVMDVVRQRMGFTPALATLIASEAVNVLTVAAEVGGIALILQLLFVDVPFRILLLVAVAVLTAVVFVLPFSAIERVFGYGGLFLTVYIVAVFKLHPDWSELLDGFVPHWQTGQDTAIYWSFFVGVIAAALIPYEVYFDVRARRERERPDAKVEEPWVVVALLVGRKGLLRRLGVPAQERGERPAAGPSPGVVEWERVERVDGEVLVRD